MPKLLFTTSSFDLNNFREREAVERAGFELVLNPHGKRLTEEQVSGFLKDDVVGIVAGLEPLTQAVLAGANGLKVIARCGIGMDNVDLGAAEQLGISVFNTPDAPTRAVAELTLAHMLSLARRVAQSDRALRAGKWQPLMGSLLSFQTVGLVGFGRIGKTVGRMLSGLGPRLLVYDAAPVTWTHECMRVVSLKELLSGSDIVSLHVPYQADTHHIIDEAALARMKPGALLINAARGGLIDETALLAALKSRHLGGVALDCFESEPYSGPLLECDNVQATAHMGSYAREARAVMEAEACDALMRGLRQHSLL
jgi:D-3-phosphoglycerate dehydrogenase